MAVVPIVVIVALCVVLEPGTLTSIVKLSLVVYVADPPAVVPVTLTTPAVFLRYNLNVPVVVPNVSYCTYNVPTARSPPPATGLSP